MPKIENLDDNGSSKVRRNSKLGGNERRKSISKAKNNTGV